MNKRASTIYIETTERYEAPVVGARRVFWLIKGVLVHKGWLMPGVYE